jgi:hypothetical protein
MTARLIRRLTAPEIDHKYLAAALSHRPTTSDIPQPRTTPPTENNIHSNTTANHVSHGDLLHAP